MFDKPLATPPPPPNPNPNSAPALETGEDTTLTAIYNDDGSVEVILGDPNEDDPNEDMDEADEEKFKENLADTLDPSVLQTLAQDLLHDIEEDMNSRKDWVQMFVDGIDLLGMKLEERTEPWIGACGVYHPLLAEAVVRFQAETVMETLPAAGPVRTKILGEETPQATKQAKLVQDDMNDWITTRMPEYRPEHEKAMWGVALSGNAFKKVYHCPLKQRPTSIFVPGEEIIVPYGASDLQTSPRITHVMHKTENELRKLIVDGFYADIGIDNMPEPQDSYDEIEKKIAEKQGFTLSINERYRIYECCADLYIEDDKYRSEEQIARPYIITIEKQTQQVLGLRRNWSPEDSLCARRQYYVHYPYIPGFGFYAFGMVHLLGAYARSGTSILRQLVDAGELSNLPGGFKTSGSRFKGDETPIAPGEFRDMDVPDGSLKDNIMALPFKEPSVVLAQLLDKIIEEGRRFASVADMQISDMSANAPVGTTLAILERQLKVMSAVQARVHYAMKQELCLLKCLIEEHLEDEGESADTKDRPNKLEAYRNTEVIPVSDPNAATMAQRVVQYQAVLQLAQMAPQIYNMPALHRQMLEVLGIKHAEKLVQLPDDQKPTDPISENMAILTGKPVKAFLYQDHQAHIGVHMAAMQDPKIMALVGQSPNAQQLQAASQAHIAEHLAYEYRKQMEQMMGAPLPDPKFIQDGIPPEMEINISRAAMQASQQLLQRNTQEQAAQNAQQAAQDPLVQIQLQELEIKREEVQVKREQVAQNREEIQLKAQIEGVKIGNQLGKDKHELELKERLEGAKLGARVGEVKYQTESQQKLEGTKLGHDIAKTMYQQKQQGSHQQRQQSHTEKQSERDHTLQALKHQQEALYAQQQHELAVKQASAAKSKPTKGKNS